MAPGSREGSAAPSTLAEPVLCQAPTGDVRGVRETVPPRLHSLMGTDRCVRVQGKGVEGGARVVGSCLMVAFQQGPRLGMVQAASNSSGACPEGAESQVSARMVLANGQ